MGFLYAQLHARGRSREPFQLTHCRYVAGALMFAFRIPEIWFPGRHDIWFHSHQWMHICVVAAAFIHWMGLVELLKIRLRMPCVGM